MLQNQRNWNKFKFGTKFPWKLKFKMGLEMVSPIAGYQHNSAPMLTYIDFSPTSMKRNCRSAKLSRRWFADWIRRCEPNDSNLQRRRRCYIVSLRSRKMHRTEIIVELLVKCSVSAAESPKFDLSKSSAV